MCALDAYPLRLPPYCASHLGRFHPYPRVSRPHDRRLTVSRVNASKDWCEGKALVGNEGLPSGSRGGGRKGEPRRGGYGED